ncbi:MAG: hypothetical protein PF437_11435 [Sulfurimonas sp.]|jgi:predicted exporter|nr:hypothetical protein [Sulfurimonas sp.]
MIKYANFIILFILLSVGLLLKDNIHISTNLLSLFATKESVEKLNIANNLGYSKEMLIAVKGFDKRAKEEVRQISKELKKLKYINFVQSSIVPTQEIQEYYKKYYPILATFDDANITQEQVSQKLQALYDAQLSSVFYSSINKNDPLSLFELQNIKRTGISNKGEFIALGEYGLLVRVMTDISPSQMNEAKELYRDVHTLLSKYPEVVAFAPFFYTVENSTKIQEDVQWIIILSTVVLLLIYYLLIKNIRLLSQTVIALFSSMVFASLVSTMFIENFNILSLAFGMSLTAVSIDYLLHYHFHNFYATSQKIDKNVLYGYLTTVIAFGIFSFIPIPLIAQISSFAVLSLSFAYVLFTFVFPLLGLKKYEEVRKVESEKREKKVPALLFFVLSLALFTYSAFNFKLDSNIRNLDYQNLHLLKAEKLFKSNSGAKMTPVIVQASTQEKLIEELHALKILLPDTFSLATFVKDKQSCKTRQEELKTYDFKRLNRLINEEASKIGFKDAYFKDAYSFVSPLASCDVKELDVFKTYGLSLYHDENIYYTMALVSDVKKIQKLPFITNINVKEMFNKSAQKMYSDLLYFGAMVLIIIFVLLLVSVRARFIYAINYILFPLSFTVAILVSLDAINIMHLFSLIILIAIGIDYGIYMSNSKKPSNTMLAIKYSLLSTVAAFGVLIFSTIVALNSIGVVITLGCGAIFILIKAMR